VGCWFFFVIFCFLGVGGGVFLFFFCLGFFSFFVVGFFVFFFFFFFVFFFFFFFFSFLVFFFLFFSTPTRPPKKQTVIW